MLDQPTIDRARGQARDLVVPALQDAPVTGTAWPAAWAMLLFEQLLVMQPL